MSFIGMLNIDCIIQQKATTPDATTGELIDSWSDFATAVKCRLDEAGGGEVRTATDIFVRATHMLFLEYRTDLDEMDYRIKIGSDIYNILSVRQAGGAAHHTELDLERIV